MPDWFYRTISRPVLFRFSGVRARELALGFMSRLARLPLGGMAIDFLGHMRADPRLSRTFHDVVFPAPVGLAPGLDSQARALPALARFGFGFLEVGPITLAAGKTTPLQRRPHEEAIWYPDPPEGLSLPDARKRLSEAARGKLPLIGRLGSQSGQSSEQVSEECVQAIRELAPFIHFFSLATHRQATSDAWNSEHWRTHLETIVQACRAAGRPILLCLGADFEMETGRDMVDAALTLGLAGFLIDGSVAGEGNGRRVGAPARQPALTLVGGLRQRLGPNVLLIASGGVHEPEDALALRVAGADLIQIDSGLVYSGPGLPKRTNEVLLFEELRRKAVDSSPSAIDEERAPEMTWFWCALMGAGMLAGSLLALLIAATRVVLPYDEDFVGMSRAELANLNPRLLPFLTHDRVSLAGAMVAIGVLYLGLSLYGIRQGLHWARQTVFISAFTGFASFFLFLGFGYLDPFHAFVTVVLLQLLLLGVHGRLATHTPNVPPVLREDAAWRRSLWGQLLLIFHGTALLGAGVAISLVGVTHVFVHEDLDFMATTAEALREANPRLIPLIAHDRATFGGMLLASGWGFLLPSLWGFRAGSAWLWWTLLIAGCSAYAAAIGVHFLVGYTDVMHLLPAFLGLGILLLGLVLSRTFLCGKESSGPETN